MGKFIVERWRCDRCLAEDDKWLKPRSAYEICASVDHGTERGIILDMQQLCVPCNDAVAKEIEGIRKSMLAARAPHD
jgi:hypothetical protein